MINLSWATVLIFFLVYFKLDNMFLHSEHGITEIEVPFGMSPNLFTTLWISLEDGVGLAFFQVSINCKSPWVKLLGFPPLCGWTVRSVCKRFDTFFSQLLENTRCLHLLYSWLIHQLLIFESRPEVSDPLCMFFLSQLTFPYFDGLVTWSDLNLVDFHCRRGDMMICYYWKRSKLPLTTLSFWRQNLVTKLPSCLTQLIIVVCYINKLKIHLKIKGVKKPV